MNWDESMGAPLGELGFLPDMDDGEILYSWTCHFHRLSGNAHTIDTSRKLFGNISAAFRRDFPSQLKHFELVTQSAFGSARKLARQRSLLGFFAPFRSKKVVLNIVLSMGGDDISPLKLKLGIFQTKLGAFHTLKACPDCIAEDMQRNIISKWHLEHQWPSSWVCRKHKRILKFVKRELFPGQHIKLILPHELSECDWDNSAFLSQELIDRLDKVAEFSSHLSFRHGFHFNINTLRFAYLIGVRDKCWISTEGTVNKKLWTEYLTLYSELEKLPDMRHGNLFRGNEQSVLRLMRNDPHQRHQHPIRHYLLMAFLFDSIEEFDNAYALANLTMQEGGSEAIHDLLNEPYRLKLKQLIENDGLSIAQASNSAGITFPKAKNLMVKYGIKYRRKYDLEPQIEEKLIQLIVSGAPRKQIGSIMGVDRDFIKHYFDRRPDLLKIWHAKNDELQKKSARENYLALLKRLGAISLSKLYDIPRSKFRWLRKHDLAWLIENSPQNVSALLRAYDGEKCNVRK